MIKTLLSVLIAVEVVFCGTDLCENGIRLDSITYVDTNSMWFFTSGGHYWYLKAQHFPPKDPGTPLPSPFTRGDAAIYKNTLDGCKGITADGGKETPEEQEIHLIEHVNGKNQVLIYDVRTNEWSSEPKSIENYKDLTQAKIDWTKPIDAAFTHQKTFVVIVQDKKYSVVDTKPLCRNPDNYGDSKKQRPITDFNHQDKIQSTATYNDSVFLLFSKDSFWKVTKRYYSSDWRIQGTKGFQQDPGTEFFKYEENCKLPPIDEDEEPETPPGSGPVGNPEPPEATEGSNEEETEEPAGGETDPEPTEKDGNEFPWIIVVIVVIIVIILAIILVACLAMRKKGDDKANAEAGGSAAGGSSVGSKTAPSNVSSAQSVRSKGGSQVGSKTGSKVGSKAGSKTGSATKGPSSSMGTSPSTMSVRSNPGLSTASKSKASSTGSKK